MKKSFFVTALLFLAASLSVKAASYFSISNTTYTGGGPDYSPGAPFTGSLNKNTDTYYVQFSVTLTSSLTGHNTGVIPNTPNIPNGGAAFQYYDGNGLTGGAVLAGFSTSTWNTNSFVAYSGNTQVKLLTNPNDLNSTLQAKWETEYIFDVAVNLPAKTYSISVTEMGANNSVVDVASASNLSFVDQNAWNNNSFGKLNFHSSTGVLTANFGEIDAATTPIPEPSSVFLIGMGAAFLLWRPRRRS